MKKTRASKAGGKRRGTLGRKAKQGKAKRDERDEKGRRPPKPPGCRAALRSALFHHESFMRGKIARREAKGLNDGEREGERENEKNVSAARDKRLLLFLNRC